MIRATAVWVLAYAATIAIPSAAGLFPPWAAAVGSAAGIVAFACLLVSGAARELPASVRFAALLALPAAAGALAAGASLAIFGVPPLPRTGWLPAAPHPVFAAFGFFALFAVFAGALEVLVRACLHDAPELPPGLRARAAPGEAAPPFASAAGAGRNAGR